MSQRLYLAGVVAQVFLTGTLTVQVVDYFPNYFRRDPLTTKCFVFAAYCATTAITACGLATLWTILDPRPEVPFGLDRSLPASLDVASALFRVPETLVHIWMLQRLYLVTARHGRLSSFATTAVGILLWLVSFAAGLKLAYWQASELSTWATYLNGRSVWATDLYLALAFALSLQRTRVSILDARLSKTLGSIGLVAVLACLITMVCTLSMTVLYSTGHNDWLVLQFILPPLYTCSMLFTLNFRDRRPARTGADSSADELIAMDPTGLSLVFTKIPPSSNTRRHTVFGVPTPHSNVLKRSQSPGLNRARTTPDDAQIWCDVDITQTDERASSPLDPRARKPSVASSSRGATVVETHPGQALGGGKADDLTLWMPWLADPTP
ncbi:hypothetical protein JCM21900_004274 [Sporobolomyces salmonicolor]